MYRDPQSPYAPPLSIGILGYGLDRPLTGISRYTLELLSRLGTRTDVETTLLAPCDTSHVQLPRSVKVKRLHGVRLLPTLLAAGPNQLRLANRSGKFDVLFDPTGIGPFPRVRRNSRRYQVLTIHDAVPFVYPETQTRMTRYLFERHLPAIAQTVDAVVTCSLSAQRDLSDCLSIPLDKITVIPHGVSARFVPMNVEEAKATAERLGLPSRFVLAVGSIEPRKNLTTLFRAHEQLLQRAPESPPLVVVGKRGWKDDEIISAASGLPRSVIFTGYVSDDDLPAVYAAASCFVYPSLYEGFGLPLLEAMASGVPVVTSDTSSLPEVVGNAAITVDPRDANALADAMFAVLSGRADTELMRRRGIERARSFTWERSVSAHIELFRSLAVKANMHG